MGAGEPVGGDTTNRAQLLSFGVEAAYLDATGRWREVPQRTLMAVRDAMGEAITQPPATAPVAVVGEQGPWPELPGGTLQLEGGGTVHLECPGGSGTYPEKLPLGYHLLKVAEPLAGEADQPDAGKVGEELLVAVCPPACPPPPPPRSWGWSVQLYAARSTDSWGMGDFADLASLAAWAGRIGAGFLLLNPLHTTVPGPVPEASPYFPSSRCFLNPLYISVPQVPGIESIPELGELAQKARALNADRLIDRTRVWAYKSEALEALFEFFERTGGDPGFEEYIKERGKVLDGYTSFCTLAEIHGLPWQEWPEQYRRPGDAVERFVATREVSRRKRYHAWLQWTCEQQLQKAASVGAGLVIDLAVGVDGEGADAWLWQDLFALRMRVGAPPDDFNLNGQDWGLPPWDPWKLRSAAYEPYIEMLRAVLRPAIGIRIDHVMGLFRLFWIPLGSLPEEGAYVRYPWQDMLGLLRLEANRACAFVVGEDLGTVEEHVRDALSSSGVLSYKLFWFEERPPPEWQEHALGAVTTHDLPTVAGVWTGSDAEAQRSLGLPMNEGANEDLRRRLVNWASVPEGRPVAEVVRATYACLASAPCALLAAVLEDAALVQERPNMPGTTNRWPNWSLALPVPIERLEESELAAAIARDLGSRTP